MILNPLCTGNGSFYDTVDLPCHFILVEFRFLKKYLAMIQHFLCIKRSTIINCPLQHCWDVGSWLPLTKFLDFNIISWVSIGQTFIFAWNDDDLMSAQSPTGWKLKQQHGRAGAACMGSSFSAQCWPLLLPRTPWKPDCNIQSSSCMALLSRAGAGACEP